MGEHQRFAGSKVRGNFFLVKTLLDVVGNQHHDHIGLSNRVSHGGDSQALCLSLRPALASLVQPDDDVDAGVAQIEGMSVTLTAIPDDRHRLALERVETGVALVIDLRGHATSPVIIPAPRAVSLARAHRPRFPRTSNVK
jgi:hypothetical protein